MWLPADRSLYGSGGQRTLYGCVELDGGKDTIARDARDEGEDTTF